MMGALPTRDAEDVATTFGFAGGEWSLLGKFPPGPGNSILDDDPDLDDKALGNADGTALCRVQGDLTRLSMKLLDQVKAHGLELNARIARLSR